MPTGLPSRRWCREVIALRGAMEGLLARGAVLTDPYVLALSLRLDRLMLDRAAGAAAPAARPRA